MEAYDKRNNETLTWDVIEAVQDVAELRRVSMAQVALAWVTDRARCHFDHPRRAHRRTARQRPGRVRSAPEPR